MIITLACHINSDEKGPDYMYRPVCEDIAFLNPNKLEILFDVVVLQTKDMNDK